jgi:hypothetical protein
LVLRVEQDFVDFLELRALLDLPRIQVQRDLRVTWVRQGFEVQEGLPDVLASSEAYRVQLDLEE